MGIGLTYCLLLIAILFLGHPTYIYGEYDTSLLMKGYPEAHSQNNRLLGLILAYNLDHIDPLLLIFNEYVSMCEGGWNTTVVLFTTVDWSPRLRRFIRQKTYCYRMGKSLDVRYSLHNASISVGLGAEHRKYLGNEVNNFDVFVYHEDDMVFKHSHLVAFLAETKKLHYLMPEFGLRDHTIGFQRYRRLLRSGEMHHVTWGEQDIIEQDLLEETPNFRLQCIKDEPYLLVEGNIHQAMWVFTQQHIHLLQEKCYFLNQSNPSREYMSSFSIFDKKKWHCALNKLIPGERLTTFTVNHYYQQRHVSWIPVFFADEDTRAGLHYSSKAPVDIPPCWAEIANATKQEMMMFTPTTAPSAVPTAPPTPEVTFTGSAALRRRTKRKM